MQPIVTKFAESRPRLFGLLVLTSAIVLGLLGQRFIASGIPFVWILLLTGLGVVGALYIAFGRNAHRWRMARPIQDRLSWKQVCIDAGLPLLIFAMAGLLDWILSR